MNFPDSLKVHKGYFLKKLVLALIESRDKTGGRHMAVSAEFWAHNY